MFILKSFLAGERLQNTPLESIYFSLEHEPLKYWMYTYNVVYNYWILQWYFEILFRKCIVQQTMGG